MPLAWSMLSSIVRVPLITLLSRRGNRHELSCRGSPYHAKSAGAYVAPQKRLKDSLT
jgi:hypothetical protein